MLLAHQEVKAPQEENIPQGLRETPQWTLWNSERRTNQDGTVYLTKEPCLPDGRRYNWKARQFSFEEVMTAYDPKKHQGIGFILTEDDPFACIDLDADSLDQIPEEHLVYANQSYTEISPSGNGLHVWVQVESSVKADTTVRKKGGIELFLKNKFVTVTGDPYNDLEIEENTGMIQLILSRMDAQKKSPDAIVGGEPTNTMSDGDVLRLAGLRKDAKKAVRAMRTGDISEFNNDHSQADWNAIATLAEITPDDGQVKRIFMKTALYRDPSVKGHKKSGHVNYLDETIRKVRDSVFALKIKPNDNIAHSAAVEPSNAKERPNWWHQNENGTHTFLHHVMGDYLLKRYAIVRHPDAHGDIYIYNPKSGVYENDKTCRQLRSLIRREEILKNNKIKEVQDYILDTSDIVAETSPDHVALNNGLLNITTVEVEKFTPEVFVTSKIPTDYNPKAHDEFVKQTIYKVADGHAPTIHNIGEMFACVLYPKVLVPKMFYLYGRTAHNGKSSILYLIHKTFNLHGGNISSVTPQKLAENTFAGSGMYGKLANIVDDQPDQVINDAGTLKSVITGGYVDIEQKGKDSRTVEMNVTMITASNYYPNFKENGKQVNRRLHIIPFEHDFSTDPDCLSEVETFHRLSTQSAREYTLLIAIRKLKEMLAKPGADKLTPNDKADAAGQEFADHNDPLADFFFEYDKDFFEEVPGQRALQAYEEWCRDNRISHPLGVKRFKEAVCMKYNMVWKDKRVSLTGRSKIVKGFKSR